MCNWTLILTLLGVFIAAMGQSEDVENTINDLQEAEQEEADKNQISDTSMDQIKSFLSSTPYIKAIGYNSITQLYKIKEYGIKLNLSGHKLFKALRTDYAKPHGSFLKLCKKTDHIYSDEDLPIPKEFDCCPFPNIKCRLTTLKYRSIDGSCNCKGNSHMGRSNRAYARFIYPDYADGISSPRVSSSGQPLPSARLVSTVIFKAQQRDIKSEILTVMHMTTGQFLDHDLDRTPISKFQDSNGTLVDIKCGKNHCAIKGATKKECFPIKVPHDEKPVLKKCMGFIRSQAYMADGCKIGPREQPNVVTSWVDCSFLYGSSVQELDIIRDQNKNRGKMAVTKHPLNDQCKPLAPTKVDTGCKGLDPNGPIKCFLTGDARQNEQVGIISMHIMFIRLHNYFEEKFHGINPHWDGERLFQETRRLVIAVWQNIAYGEYIPAVLGHKAAKKYGLNMKDECYKGYNCRDFSSDVTNVFATAAFRFGHSQITEMIMLKASSPKVGCTKNIPYQSALFNPNIIYETHFDNTTCGVDAIMLGHSQQLTDQSDDVFPDSMRNHLFSDNPPFEFGLDLAALDIQRGRDHGLPGYNAWRKWCGLPVARKFNELVDIPKHLHKKFKELYQNVDDIDVFVGGMVEDHVTGGIVGRTFACIIGRQFQNIKVADRFWFERCHKDSGFTLEQIRNIKQYSSGRLLCDTLDHVTSIQKFTMMKPRRVAEKRFSDNPKELAEVLKLYRGEENSRQACRKHPGIDFNLFKDEMP